MENASPRGIYCLAPLNGWNNQQLTKNCGIVPYLFHKLYGFHAVMVGTKLGDYPALETYVKGLQLDFLPDASMETEISYVKSHAKDMDVLVLHSAYDFYFPIVKCYRALRPDGKIYLELDANVQWADRTEWDRAVFLEFLQCCDVVGASCRRMQKYIGQKWPCVVEYIPNGFYDFSQMDLSVDFTQKENIILTVGRIGTKQKNNELLLEAFAEVAMDISDWRIRLVGPVENTFFEYLRSYGLQHPDVIHRVECVGPIRDKKRLMSEYQRAKIFALTSRLEGGTPNVVAEALYGGCYMLTSEIDASEDITDQGHCGASFPIDGKEDLAHILRRICTSEDCLQKGGQHAARYGRETFDFLKIVPRLYYLLFQEAPAWGK